VLCTRWLNDWRYETWLSRTTLCRHGVNQTSWCLSTWRVDGFIMTSTNLELQRGTVQRRCSRLLQVVSLSVHYGGQPCHVACPLWWSVCVVTACPPRCTPSDEIRGHIPSQLTTCVCNSHMCITVSAGFWQLLQKQMNISIEMFNSFSHFLTALPKPLNTSVKNWLFQPLYGSSTKAVNYSC